MFGAWFNSSYRHTPFSYRFSEEEKQFACDKCGEVFRSKVALRRHETYVCNNANAIFSTLNREFRQSQVASATASTKAATVTTSSAHISPIPKSSPSENLSSTHSGKKDIESTHLLEQSGGDTGQDSEMIEEGLRHRQFVFDSANASATSLGLALAATSTPSKRRDSTSTNEPDPSELGIFGNSNNNLKQFPCENCDKVFTDPSNLQRHIRSTHVGARSHTCSECGKTFATSSGLKQHQHIHSSVKPFQCEVCLKAYTQFSNLCRHKRMHADCRQQIKCKDCGQAFSTMTSLSKHKRFCEGMLRNGARFSFPPSTPEKTMPPHSLSHNPMASQQASALTAAYMNFYGPRPPFPFYPPLGPGGLPAGFPLFPPGHPLTAMTPPILPDAKFSTSTTHSVAAVSPSNTSTPKKYVDEKPSLPSAKPLFHSGSEGTDISDVSTPNHSDLDSHGSDADSESELEKTSDRAIEEKPSSVSPRPASNHVLPSPSTSRSSHQSPAPAHSPVTNLPSKDLKKGEGSPDSGLLDLSKASSSSGDQPLDLSTKVKKEEIPVETPRKTHIFGESRKRPLVEEPVAKPVAHTPEKRSSLHQAYPTMPTTLMMDQMYRMEKDRFQSLQEAARMMSMPRFPIPQPVPPIHSVHSMLPRGPFDPLKSMAPMMKLDRPEGFPYSHGVHKLKDRYSCKFCGKIFPRSANLTRHLRTHTGEQPYKCKYCERSFSISSNLQRHVRNIHNKEKPFKCPLCDRCFGQQTNLDRHLKKHESEGPNVIDSPPQADHDLDEKEESYFDEIRNFIGKATSDGHESPKTHDYRNIDSNFSIMAQIEKQKKIEQDEKDERKRGSEEDELAEEEEMVNGDEEEMEDDLIDDEEDDASVEDSSKKSQMENNNDDSGLEHDKAMNLSNGFHDNNELSKHLNGRYDVKSLSTPLTIST